MLAAALLLLQVAASIARPAGRVDAEELLRATLRDCYPAVTRWEVRAFSDATKVSAGEVSIVRLGSRSAVRVGNHVYWYAVAGFQTVVSAMRAARAGETLDAHFGRIAEADVLAAACEPLTDASRLEGTRARRAMHADQIICGDFIEPRPPVARGDDVVVHYLGRNVSLTTRGVAETDGALGENVNVKRLGATDVYRAVVSGEREVTIHE